MRSGFGIRSNGWIGIARHDLFNPRCRDQGVSNQPSQIFQVAGNESVSQHQPLHHHHHHPSPCSCAAMLPCCHAAALPLLFPLLLLTPLLLLLLMLILCLSALCDTCKRLACLVALSAALPATRLLRQARRQSSRQLIIIVQQSLRLRVRFAVCV